MSLPRPSVMIVDDDKNNLLSLAKVFERDGFAVTSAGSGREALDRLAEQEVDVVLTDLMMPGLDGVDLLQAVKARSPDTEVVVMTAFGKVETAVEAMKRGAYDFVQKPFDRKTIVKTLRKAAERHSLVVENRDLKTRLSRFEKRGLVGQSAAFRRVLDVALQAAPSLATVLVTGESGTGKELVARAIHDHSARAARPFVAVNCAAIPESIMEAELFGHEKGAFTGAVQRRDGRFRLADTGTLFLDEVGEMSPAVQVKLLRVLQEGELDPVGGKTVKVDVRVVAATNRDLEEDVRRGAFREDLFYRLNVIVVSLPPLRQRLDDVPLLAEHFLALHAARNGKTLAGIGPEALARLSTYWWPGNVRELENVIERAVVLCRGPLVTLEDLPERLLSEEPFQGQIAVSVGTSLEEVELRLIKETLRYTKGDKKLAAQLLGIATRTIYRKLDAMEP